MKWSLKYVFLFLLLKVILVSAQTSAGKNIILRIDTVTLMDIEPDNSAISIVLQPSPEAGEASVSTTNDLKWINYSNSLFVGDSNLDIYIELDQSISGLDLMVQAETCLGCNGQIGVPEPMVTVTSIPQKLISNIGGAYTGNGVNFGHQLQISAIVSDYALISAIEDQVIRLFYTIQDY